MERLNASRSPVFYGFLLAFECLMWGVSNSVSKLGFSSISPMWCLALRYALSTLLFLAAFGKRFFYPRAQEGSAALHACFACYRFRLHIRLSLFGVYNRNKRRLLDGTRSRNCAVSFHSALEGKAGCAQSRSCCNRCGGDVLHLRRYVFHLSGAVSSLPCSLPFPLPLC